MPGPSLDLRGQDVQELLQHQELQNLLLGVHLGLQPLTAQLPEVVFQACYNSHCHPAPGHILLHGSLSPVMHQLQS